MVNEGHNAGFVEIVGSEFQFDLAAGGDGVGEARKALGEVAGDALAVGEGELEDAVAESFDDVADGFDGLFRHGESGGW